MVLICTHTHGATITFRLRMAISSERMDRFPRTGQTDGTGLDWCADYGPHQMTILMSAVMANQDCVASGEELDECAKMYIYHLR